jgi:hypothetical protein
MSYSISKNAQIQEDLRRRAEQEKNAYIAYILGRDLTGATMFSVQFGKRTTLSLLEREERRAKFMDRLNYLQGLVDQLGLRLELKSLFEFIGTTSEGYISPTPALDSVYDRILNFHSKKIASAFNLSRWVIWLSDQIACIDSEKDMQKYLKIYSLGATIINDALIELSTVTKKDLSNSTLPDDPTKVENIDVRIHMILARLEQTVWESRKNVIRRLMIFKCS